MKLVTKLYQIQSISSGSSLASYCLQIINIKKARTLIDLGLNYTRKIVKKHDSNSLEGLKDIISTLHKEQGIICQDLSERYTTLNQGNQSIKLTFSWDFLLKSINTLEAIDESPH